MSTVFESTGCIDFETTYMSFTIQFSDIFYNKVDFFYFFIDHKYIYVYEKDA